MAITDAVATAEAVVSHTIRVAEEAVATVGAEATATRLRAALDTTAQEAPLVAETATIRWAVVAVAA